MEGPEDPLREPENIEDSPFAFQKRFGQLIVQTLSKATSLPVEQIRLCEGGATKIDKDKLVFFLEAEGKSHAITAEIKGRFLTNLQVVDLQRPA